MEKILTKENLKKLSKAELIDLILLVNHLDDSYFFAAKHYDKIEFQWGKLTRRQGLEFIWFIFKLYVIKNGKTKGN